MRRAASRDAQAALWKLLDLPGPTRIDRIGLNQGTRTAGLRVLYGHDVARAWQRWTRLYLTGEHRKKGDDLADLHADWHPLVDAPRSWQDFPNVEDT